MGVGELPGGVVELAICYLHTRTGVSETGVRRLGHVSPNFRAGQEMEVWGCAVEDVLLIGVGCPL